MAQAFASFCKYAGHPYRSDNSAQMGTSSHSGRFGGAWITPRRVSSGPPQLTPTAAGAAPPLYSRSSASIAS